MARDGELTVKRQRFVDEYLTDGNATQSAIRAGYSVRTAKAIASELLTFPDVQAALRTRQQEAAQRTGITIQRIMEEFAKLAFTDLNEIVSWKGGRLTLTDSVALTPAMAAAVAEVSEHDTLAGGRALRVKLYSKHAALESLLKCIAAIDLEARVQALEDAQKGASWPRQWRSA